LVYGRSRRRRRRRRRWDPNGGGPDGRRPEPEARSETFAEHNQHDHHHEHPHLSDPDHAPEEGAPDFGFEDEADLDEAPAEAGLSGEFASPRPDDEGPADEPWRDRPRRRRRRRRGGGGGPVPDERLRQMLDLLRREFGLRHFRPGQEEIIRAVLDGRDTLAVLPTGGGKSLTYQLPSLVLPGLTVVVSPLIALIRDQFEKLRAQGIETVRVDSSLTGTEKEEALTLLEQGSQKIVLITPEGATGPAFKKRIADQKVSLLVIDEAHCVSEWGHDFRPSYLALGALAEDLGRPTVLALTATAPPLVREEIVKRLGLREPAIVVRPVARPNLRFEVKQCMTEDVKRRELVQYLRRLRRPGIVYCSTVKDVEELGALCKIARIPAEIYHGRLTKAERDHAHKRFMSSGKRIVMIATSAFGLGVDKPDIRYVLHYQVPGSLEAYVQEAGRAGRDGLPARCILLWDPRDIDVQRHFLSEGPATRSQIKKVVEGLSAWSKDGRAVDASVLAMATEVGVTRTKAILEGLRDADLVAETDGQFSLSREIDVNEAVKLLSRRNEERKTTDRRRLESIIHYANNTEECRMMHIRRYFEDGEPTPCGHCDVCEPKLRRRRRRSKGRRGGPGPERDEEE
ncbi:MAG TPA: ATP-dependent DNA helicase RecQ, partial [Myxococcota bacterium]|nr:ATP-dependent DNA helicase RecQ [Myxococcota bacterium]